MLIIYAMRVRVDPSPLQTHLSSGLLLDYDPKVGAYRQTEEFGLLVRVIQQGHLLYMSGNVDPEDFTEYGKPLDADGTRQVPVLLHIVLLPHMLWWDYFKPSYRKRVGSGKRG